DDPVVATVTSIGAQSHSGTAGKCGRRALEIAQILQSQRQTAIRLQQVTFRLCVRVGCRDRPPVVGSRGCKRRAIQRQGTEIDQHIRIKWVPGSYAAEQRRRGLQGRLRDASLTGPGKKRLAADLPPAGLSD